jgi:general secretion pathway protein H
MPQPPLSPHREPRSAQRTSREVALRAGAPRAQVGFTLLELLVVVAIAGLLVGLLASTFGQVSSAELRTQSNKVASLMRQCFSYAVSHGKYVRLIIDMSSGQLSVEATGDPVFLSKNKRESGEDPNALSEEQEERNEKAKEEGRPLLKRAAFNKEAAMPELKLTKGVRVVGVFTPNQEDVFREGKAYVHFFPNGFAEPALVYVSNKNEGGSGVTYSLALAPLTGKVTRTFGELEVDRYFGQPADEEEE